MLVETHACVGEVASESPLSPTDTTEPGLLLVPLVEPGLAEPTKLLSNSSISCLLASTDFTGDPSPTYNAAKMTREIVSEFLAVQHFFQVSKQEAILAIHRKHTSAASPLSLFKNWFWRASLARLRASRRIRFWAIASLKSSLFIVMRDVMGVM